MTKEEEFKGFKEVISKPYPQDLNECLQVFENINYKSYGFPLIFISYNFTWKYWDVTFRNPSNFSNPNIQGKTPIDAVHKMFDFLYDGA